MSGKAEACAFSVGQDNNEKVSAGWGVFLCRNANQVEYLLNPLILY
jgi:hypothetical protein